MQRIHRPVCRVECGPLVLTYYIAGWRKPKWRSMVWCTGNPVRFSLPSSELLQASAISRRIKTTEAGSWLLSCRGPLLQKPKGFMLIGTPVIKVSSVRHAECSDDWFQKPEPKSLAVDERLNNKPGKKEHHLWRKRESTGSGQKALNLVRIVSGLPNEKEAVYGALDKWTAWEAEFPLIAASKALRILRKRNQWLRIIQVSKWMLAKGQGLTMGTYDMLLLAFDMDGRVDEAESLWNRIVHTHTRSVSKRLFSRMISLYDHHHMMEKIIEVFADMEEVGVKPDLDTVRRVAGAFQKLGQEDKKKMVLKKYQSKWKYMHFNGERVRVRTDVWDG